MSATAKAKYPAKGTFQTDKELKSKYKKLTDEEVFEWCKQEGLSYTTAPDHPNITRMRACMAILYYHFPKAPSAKKASPYKEYSTEELISMAVDKKVPFESTDDQRIMRMRAIMALRASGHLQ